MKVVFEKKITKYVDGKEEAKVSTSETETWENGRKLPGLTPGIIREEYEEILDRIVEWDEACSRL